MHWVLAGFLMFIASVVTYLLVRASAIRHMAPSIQNLSMFIIPLFVYIPMIMATGTPFMVTPYQAFLMVASAVLFSYLGSRFSVLSIQYAPNPGYSLILSKSYVVLTTIVAVLLFRASLSVMSACAILLIVGCSGLIMVDPKATRKTNGNTTWLPLALGAFVCWGMLAIMSKYLLDIGVPIFIRLFWVTGVACLLFAWDTRKEFSDMKKYSAIDWLLFVGIGVFSGIFNYFMQVGYQRAPNIGFINALNAASIAFVTLGASIFFHDEFSIRKFTGVVGVIGGLILLVL